MKIHKLLFAALAAALFVCGVSAQDVKKDPPKPRPGFDAELAKKVGANKNGMRKYVLVILKTGPKIISDKAEEGKIFAGHFANMKRLANEGKLALAGPFFQDPPNRGLFIFAVETIEEAKKLTETDPVIVSGMMVAEYHPWFGTAALMEVNGLHDKVTEVEM